MSGRRVAGHVLAVTRPGRDDRSVRAVAEALAELLDARVRDIDTDRGAGGVDRILGALAERSVRLAVLASADLTGPAWPVLQRAGKPVVVAPGTGWPMHRISRALIPLDGTAESAGAVAQTNRLLSGAGVDLLVLHVFDADTVPRYWDQPGHAELVWEQEFLARFCDVPGTRLQWRRGAIGEQVLDVATAEHVDLIALGWSQRLDPGRARTVRRTLRDAAVPVLVVPVAPTDRTGTNGSGK